MQAQRYADAVMLEINAETSSVDYDIAAYYWRIDWAIPSIMGTIEIVGVDITPELLNDLADNELWIRATLRHIHEELGRPVLERARVFSIDSDGKYMKRIVNQPSVDPIDWDFE